MNEIFKLDRNQQTRWLTTIMTAGSVFALIGALLIMSGRAATLATATESERGMLSNKAFTVSDASASSGIAVRFGDPAAVGNGFLYRSGRNLMLNGSVLRYIGFNAYGMTGCRTGSAWTTAQLDTYFSNLPPHSLTRTWAFAYYGTASVRSVLNSAAKYNQKVILTLGDGNSACNDNAYAPAGDGSGKSLAFYQNGWKTTYSSWLQDIIPTFKDNPTVAFWEILNEPGNIGSDPDAVTMKSFLDGAAQLIKSLDHNHLVGSGANYSGNAGFQDFQYAHSGPDIDLVSFHEYAWEYEAGAVVSGHFNEAKSASQVLNKPFYAGEAGALAGDACASLKPSARAAYLKQKADAYLSDGASGITFWDYEPVGTSGSCSYDLRPDDPLVSKVQAYTLP